MTMDTKKSFSANLGYGKGYDQNASELEQEGSLFATDVAGSNAQIARRAQVTRSQRGEQTPKQTHTQILGPSQQQIDELLTMPAPQDALSVRDASKKTGKSKQQNTKPGRDLIKQLETPFGVSFAQVTIQTASSAAKSAGKQAFAQDDRIHFAKEAVDTTDAKDKVVLAHELVHVVQKSNTSGIAMTEAELEAEAHILGSLAARGQSIAGKVKGHAARAQRQFWNESEHMKFSRLGADSAGKRTGYDLSTIRLAPGYYVPAEEANAMMDYFESIEEIRQLAKVKGRGPGTREEIEYVRAVKLNGKDETGFSPEVKQTVGQRYYRLASKNSQHFTNPSGNYSKGKDPMGNQLKYHDLHTQAISEAIQAGHAAQELQQSNEEGKTLQDALLVENASQHYLTDAYASGHMRTHRDKLAGYWNNQMPLFKMNLIGWVAETMAEALEEQEGHSEDMRYHGPPKIVRFDIGFINWDKPGSLEVVQQALQDKPFSLGDLVAGAFHDLDNHEGIAASSGKATFKAYGDGMIEKKPETPKQHGQLERQQDIIVEAVATSSQDIATAYEMAQRGLQMQEILEHLMTANQYAAERIWPKAQQQDFAGLHKSFAELLLDESFLKGVRIFVKEKSQGILREVPGKYRRVFESEVINKLKDSPQKTLLEISEWTPNTGGGMGGHNQDDNSMDYLEQAQEIDEDLCSLTEVQRGLIDKNLASGFKSLQEYMMLLRIRNDSDCKK